MYLPAVRHGAHQQPLDVGCVQVIGLVESSVNGAAPAHTLTNMTVINATADSAWIVFQPEAGPAIYSFYYLPYRFAGGDGARYHATYESLLIPPTSPYTRVI